MIRQRGIALIQVLLVTGIIGLLMLQMGLSARDQVRRAEALAARAELALRAQSSESAIVFSMLTQPLIERPDSDNPYVAAWNFVGIPFEVDGVEFSLQDESGKLPVPVTDATGFVALLVRLGVEPDRAGRLAMQLFRLEGLGGPGSLTSAPVPGRLHLPAGTTYPIQVLEELRSLPDMDAALFARLKPLLTLYPTPGLNLVTAPPEVLSGRVSGSELDGVLQARKARELNQLSFWKLTGQDADEMTTYYPGPAVSLTVQLEGSAGVVRRATTFIVRPYTSEPLAVWQRSSAGLGGER